MELSMRSASNASESSWKVDADGGIAAVGSALEVPARTRAVAASLPATGVVVSCSGLPGVMLDVALALPSRLRFLGDECEDPRVSSTSCALCDLARYGSELSVELVELLVQCQVFCLQLVHLVLELFCVVEGLLLDEHDSLVRRAHAEMTAIWFERATTHAPFAGCHLPSCCWNATVDRCLTTRKCAAHARAGCPTGRPCTAAVKTTLQNPGCLASSRACRGVPWQCPGSTHPSVASCACSQRHARPCGPAHRNSQLQLLRCLRAAPSFQRVPAHKQRMNECGATAMRGNGQVVAEAKLLPACDPTRCLTGNSKSKHIDWPVGSYLRVSRLASTHPAMRSPQVWTSIHTFLRDSHSN